MIPVSGSAYAYSYATLGEGVAWFIGWNLVLEYLFAASTVAVGWSRYLVKLLDDARHQLPAAGADAARRSTTRVEQGIRRDRRDDQPAGGAHRRRRHRRSWCSASASRRLVNAHHRRDQGRHRRAGDRLRRLLRQPRTTGRRSFRENTGTWGQFGWSGILRASGIIFFAYIGFDAVSTAAQEAKNPQRDMPIGILASLVICTILYVLMSGRADRHAATIRSSTMRRRSPPRSKRIPQLRWLTIPVIIGALAGLTSVILVMMLAQSRIFYSMSRDGLLPPRVPRLPSAVPDAGVLHGADGHRRRPDGRPAAAQRARRAGVGRHAARLRDRLHRRAWCCA